MNVILVTQFLLLSVTVIISAFEVATTINKKHEAVMGLVAMFTGFTWIVQLGIMIYYFAAIYPAYAAPNT